MANYLLPSLIQHSRGRLFLGQTVRLPAQYTAVMPVKIDGNEGTVLLESNPTLIDMLDIEGSLLEADQGDTDST